MWMIRSLTQHDSHGRAKYWSHEFGWTWKDYAHTFTESEKDTMLLPPGSIWEEVELVNG